MAFTTVSTNDLRDKCVTSTKLADDITISGLFKLTQKRITIEQGLSSYLSLYDDNSSPYPAGMAVNKLLISNDYLADWSEVPDNGLYIKGNLKLDGSIDVETLSITGAIDADSIYVDGVRKDQNWDSAYTHVSSDGTDHTYINQDLRTTASPTFEELTINDVLEAVEIKNADGVSVVYESRKVDTTGALSGGGTLSTDLTISHSDTAGYKHIPSGGSSGQFLKYTSDGTASWQNHGLTASDVGAIPANLFTQLGDGFELSGGTTTTRKLTVKGGNKTLSGTGTEIKLDGAYTLTLTLENNTSLTLPASGTVTALGNSTTGTGNIVRQTSPSLISPTFTDPTLGDATATTINKVIITAPDNSAVLKIADGKTLEVKKNITFDGADGKTLTLNRSITLTASNDSSTLNISTGGTLGTAAFTSADSYVTPGTHSSGQVAFWTTTQRNIAGSNNLFWDSTNNRLGVGTNTPSEKLHVDGFVRSLSGYKVGNDTVIDSSKNISGANISGTGISGTTGSFSSRVESAGKDIKIDESTAGDHYALRLRNEHYDQNEGNVSISMVATDNYDSVERGAVLAMQRTGGGGTLHFRLGDGTSVNTIMSMIGTSEYVGVGTQTPSYKLDVSGYINASRVYILGDRKDDYWDSKLDYNEVLDENYEDNWVHPPITLGGEQSGLNLSANQILEVNFGNQYGQVPRGNHTHGSITAYGDSIGIGTATPDYKLDVAGDIRAVGKVLTDGSSSGNLVPSLYLRNNQNDNNTGASIDFGFSSASDYYHASIRAYRTNLGGQHASRIEILAREAIAGTGDSYLTPLIVAGYDDTTPFIDLLADTDVSGLLTVNQVTVGGNTASISGVHLEGSETYDTLIQLKNTGTDGGHYSIISTNNSWSVGAEKLLITYGIPQSSNTIIEFDKYGGAAFYGNVGIGTTTPDEELHVVGDCKITKTIVMNPINIGANNTATDASNRNPIVIGFYSEASNYYAVAVGMQAVAEGTNSVAIGVESIAGGSSSIALGYGSDAFGDFSYSLGYQSIAGNRSTAVGGHCKCYNEESVAIGYLSQVIGRGSIVIGYGSDSFHNYSVAIGYDTHTTADNQIVLGRSTSPPNVIAYGKIGVGTTNPDESIHTTGKVKADNGVVIGSFSLQYNSTSKSLDFNFIS